MSAVDTVAPAALPDGQSSVWSRLSDRFNPILVREVQQAVRGRVFPLTIMAALAVCVVITTIVASEYAEGGTGRNAFNAGLATLIPLVLFVVPMQAYQSMRTELRGGIVEQLLLSRLSPGRILFGKLQAAMVQFVLYVSVMSPLLATSYLLRGVDLPTIMVSLGFAMVLCVAATAFAVSSAAQAIVPAMQQIAMLAITFGLGIAAVSMVVFVGSGEYQRGLGWLLRSGEFGLVASGFVGLSLAATTMSWLAARSHLLHAFENKSTGFRVFLFCIPALAYGWMLLFVPSSGWPMLFASLTAALLVLGIVFGVFMITEQQKMSPRVRAHVPRTNGMALLASAWLPGRNRGLLCFVLYGALLAAIAVSYWPTTTTGWIGSEIRQLGKACVLMATYAMVFLSIGRWLRGWLPETVQGSQGGRFLLPFFLFLCCVVPLLVDGVRGGVDGWHLGHVMNPFWSIARFSDERFHRAFPVAVWTLVVTVSLMMPMIIRGVFEVLAASKARRQREPVVNEPQ